MSGPTWPTKMAIEAPQTVTLPPSAPIVGEMSFEEVEAEAQRRDGDVRAARREGDEAETALSLAREALPRAKGIDAARAALRSISDAEERLRVARELTDAMEAAYRPLALEARRLAMIKSAARFNAALAEKGAERDRIDVDLLEALDALAVLTVRREQATAEALSIRASAEQAGHRTLPQVDAGYPADTVIRTIRSLGRTLARAVAS